jgi:hypothetical protein
MVIYNVTVNINEEIQHDWLEWMKTVHIPEVMATGCFLDSRMMHLTEPQPEEGLTFAIQYRLKDRQTLDRYFDNFAPALQKAHTKRYLDQFVAFRTILDLEMEF